MSHDVTKLPKWAQLYINKLECDLKSAKERERQRLGKSASRIQVPDILNDEPLMHINEKDRIRFYLGKGRKDKWNFVEAALIRHEDDSGKYVVELRTMGTSLVAIPRASNAMIIGGSDSV